MQKTCYFKQPAGYGDIFFLLKAAEHYSKAGYRVLWSIFPQLMSVKDYLITPAEFVDLFSQNPENFRLPWSENKLSIDFQNADKRFNCRIMEAKYKLIGLDYTDWADYFNFKRNFDKERELFNKLGLEGKKYTLVGRNYGTPPNFKRKDFDVITDNEIVNLDFVEGFSIFDWCKVIEEANEIWMVETSYNFIIEKLNLKAEKLKLFSRRPDFSEVDYLFKTNWEYII